MEIRNLSQEDYTAYLHIASRAFWRGEPPDISPEEFLTDDRVRLGAYENGSLQAQYTILDFQLFFGNHRLPCGGIASVACEPSARGRGFAGALIDRSLEVMRERGQFLSLLWPFDHRYYRQYGWEWTGYDRSYTVPLRLLETSPEAERIEPVASSHYETLNPIYEEMAMRHHGPLVRSERRWTDLLEPHGNRQPACYIYRRDGRAEGLAVVRFAQKNDLARASQFVALTPDAYRALLTLFKRHASSVQRFTWSAPPDDILWNLVAHWDIKTRITPASMGRIVDLQAALQLLTPEPKLSGSVIVRVADAHAPWNEGVWRIGAEAGSVTATATDALPDVQTDIQGLTQAYWGTPSLLDLRRAGRIDVESEDAFGLLSQLLPPTPVWLADDF